MVDPRCHGRQLHLLPWYFLQIGLPLHPRRTLLQPTDTGEMRLRVVTALCDRHMGVSQRLLSSGSADVLCMEVEYENASQSEAHGDLWCRTVVCPPIPPSNNGFGDEPAHVSSACVASIIRFAYTVELVNNVDVTWNFSQLSLWAYVSF